MTFWQIWLTIAILDGLYIAAVAYKDGGSEGEVWLTFLVIPMILATLAIGRLIYGWVASNG